MYIQQRLTISLENTAARNLAHLTNICQRIFLLQLTLYNLDLGFTYGSYYVTIFMSSNDYTTSVCRLNRAILELLVLTNDVNANWPLICLKRRRQAFVHLGWIMVKKVIMSDNDGGDRREERKCWCCCWLERDILEPVVQPRKCQRRLNPHLLSWHGVDSAAKTLNNVLGDISKGHWDIMFGKNTKCPSSQSIPSLMLNLNFGL